MKTAAAPQKQLLNIFMMLKEFSHNVFIVGGAVRDLNRGKIPHDWDIVTDVPMETMIEEFENGGFSVSKTGVSHLVLNVTLNGFNTEISNFRKDVKCNGRSAEVEVGTIDDDANRRDFYINALYWNPMTGEVLDPTGKAINDIENGVVRFIGKPKDRIKEDYLRVFRFYRFVSKGFSPDKKSLKAVREMWNEAYAATTAERARIEIEKSVGVI